MFPLLDVESRRPNNKAFSLASVSCGELFIPVAKIQAKLLYGYKIWFILQQRVENQINILGV